MKKSVLEPATKKEVDLGSTHVCIFMGHSGPLFLLKNRFLIRIFLIGQFKIYIIKKVENKKSAFPYSFFSGPASRGRRGRGKAWPLLLQNLNF